MRESEVAQSCLTLCDPMGCSLPGSSVHGIFQARVLEWGAIAFSNILAQCILNTSFVLQFISVIQLFPTICNPVNCSMPGFPVHHQLPELVKLMSIELEMPSILLNLCCPFLLLPSIFSTIKVFSNESALYI